MNTNRCGSRKDQTVLYRHGLAADEIAEVCVVVPARNEQARIGLCLDSILAAKAQLQCEKAAVAVRVGVVLDRCTDSSAGIVAGYPDVSAFPADLGNVGAARSFGAGEILALSRDRPSRIWIANTDADSTVPRDWLSLMVAQANHGADVVLGTVEPDDSIGYQLRSAWHERHDSADGHSHVHGANLGVRASTYLQLGGWPGCQTGEDEELVRAAEAVGTIRIRRTGAIAVTTSGRLAGRAPKGFARYLQLLDDEIRREPASIRT